MQEDKRLKDLLVKYAVEETSENFTSTVMQRIELMSAKTYIPLLKQNPLKILIVAFLLVCTGLLVISIFMYDSFQLPFYFSIMFPAKYFSQIIFFLIAFWVVMFINHFWNKKQPALSI
jgi:hypothetical protein